MAKRYFNWKLAIVLIISIAVLALTAVGLRQWQRTNRADQGLILGNKAYDEQNWSQAAQNFGRYLAIEQNDISVLMKYAEAHLNIRPLLRNNMSQALNAYRIVLRADKHNSKAAVKLTELYLSMRLPGEAELIASKYLENNDKPGSKIHMILVRSLIDQRKFTEAVAQLKVIIQEYPEQIMAYETLGRITENRPDDFPDMPRGEHWFNEAVNKNPSSALAYISRAGFYRSSDISRTLTDLERAEKMDLSDPNDQLRLAREFINANVLDKAEQHLRAVQSASPKNQALWAIWAQLAVKSKSQEKMLEVAENSLKELWSQSWDFMPTATELFIRGGQLNRAQECISQMNQKDVAPLEVAFLEGLLALERGHLFEAIKYWNESMQLGNNSVEIRLALASALSSVGNTQSALRHLRALVTENPNLLTGHLALARLLAKNGNWAESLQHAASAKQLAPDDPEVALLYLQAQMRSEATGSTSEITQSLQKLEQVADNLPEFRLIKFQHELEQKNFTAAQKLVTELKKDFPSQIKSVIAEVELFVAQDKTDNAILLLSKALGDFPQAVEPVRYLAILLDRQGDKEKCEEIIKDALERIDQPVSRRELGLLLAEYYVQWGQKDNVYVLLNDLVQKQPEDVPLKRGLLLCSEVLNDPKRAQQIVNDIKSLEGQAGWQWRYEQARIWFASENFEAQYPQIISLLQENLQANPNDQESRILLAAAYDRSGRQQLAISTYREAVNHSPNNLRIIIPFINLLTKSMEFDEVDQLLNRASAAKLYHPQLQQFKLQSHLRHGQLSSASDVLNDLITNDPNNQANRLSLALLKIQQKKFDEAERLLADLKNQNPNSMTIAAAQVQLNLRQNKTTDALRLCDEMIYKLNNASAYIFRARINASLKRIDEAIEDLEQASAIEPENVDVWLTKSEFYRSLGRPEKAVADIQNALSLDPDNILIQKQAISLFLGSGQADKILKGKAILDKALKSNRDDTDLRLYKAGLLLNEGTSIAIDDAERILRKITDENPEVSRAWEFLGKISLGKGQAEKAMEIAFRGLSHTPNDKDLLLLKAQAEAIRTPILAIPTLKALREVDPNNIDAALLLAKIYIDNGQPDEAISLLEKQLNSSLGTLEKRRITVDLAVALYNNRSNASAQSKFYSILTSEKDSNTLVNIARGLKDIRDKQAQKTAEDILRMVLKNDSDSIDALTSLAILLQTSGRSDESVPFYKRALELQPDNRLVINNLAWLLCEDKGMFEEALQLAQKGLKMYPNYIDLIDTRGTIYYQMGEFDKAVKDFTKCIRLYPTETPTAVGSRFRLAKTFIKLGQNVKAIEQLEQALNLQSQIGGLTTLELTEAQTLLNQLKEGK